MRSLSLLRLDLSVAVPLGLNATKCPSTTTLYCVYAVTLRPITASPPLCVPLLYSVPHFSAVALCSIPMLHPATVI